MFEDIQQILQNIIKSTQTHCIKFHRIQLDYNGIYETF